MWINKAELNNIKYDLQQMTERYWTLRTDVDLLLAHLKVEIHTTIPRRKLAPLPKEEAPK